MSASLTASESAWNKYIFIVFHYRFNITHPNLGSEITLQSHVTETVNNNGIFKSKMLQMKIVSYSMRSPSSCSYASCSIFKSIILWKLPFEYRTFLLSVTMEITHVRGIPRLCHFSIGWLCCIKYIYNAFRHGSLFHFSLFVFRNHP